MRARIFLNKSIKNILYVNSCLAILAVSGILVSGCQGSGNSSSTGPAVSENPLKCSARPLPESDANLVEVLHPELRMISSQGTIYSKVVVTEDSLPRGAAMLTPSGHLKADQKISAIIHAASGSSGNTDPEFIPTLEGVKLSIRNSLVLANRYGHKKVAIPFIGGKIFLKRIGVTPEVLASTIIQSALENRGKAQIQLVMFDDQSKATFEKEFQALLANQEFEKDQACINIYKGSIVNFADHGASAIVNAANMEVQFGGGVSGAIGKAAKEPRINIHALSKIKKFNTHVSSLLGAKDEIQNN